MSLFAVRSAIEARLATIPNIGVIHPYERYAADPRELSAMYMVGKRLRGGFIARTATREVEVSTGHNDVIHSWQINYYVGWKESENSANGFEKVVECMRDLFRDDETLGDVVETTIVDGQAGLQLEDSGPAMFAGVLCHSARLSLQTKVDVPIGGSALDDFATGSVRIDATDLEAAPTSDDLFHLEIQV